METEPKDESSSPSLSATTAACKCRVAIIGGQRQRVAKVVAILHSDESRGSVTLGTTTTTTTTSLGGAGATATITAQISQITQTTTTTTGKQQRLQKGMILPTTVEIEYLPCVASFDSYEDEHGTTIRYLAKLEYHGPNGTLVKGKSLAPFFDDIHDDDNDGNGNENNPFPGIMAVAIGCGIETEDDVDKVRNFMETLSSSCAAQLPSSSKLNHNDDIDDDDDGKRAGLLIECIRPNPEYSSMKEENEAFRDLSQEEKKEAVASGTIGPGKMANFVYKVGEGAIRRNLEEELSSEHEPSPSLSVEEDQLTKQQQTSHAPNDEIPAVQSEPQTPELESAPTTPSDPIQSPPVVHVPNPQKNRYACRKCRTVLFGTEDLQDPPHVPSQHDFRRRGGAYRTAAAAAPCHHCLAEPLPWMECDDMEGKLRCPKCDTKVGHYSWTGAQCSCGTWVTPAIMAFCGRVDLMKPMGHDVIAATGALFVDRRGLVGASSSSSYVQPPSMARMGVSNGVGMNHLMGGMAIGGEGASSLQHGSNA